MKITNVVGCSENQCSLEGGTKITLELDGLGGDSQPRVSISGPDWACPAHCGGEAHEAECTVIPQTETDGSVTCTLPRGAIGDMDVKVAVGNQTDTYSKLSYVSSSTCPAGSTQQQSGKCEDCEAGKSAAEGATKCTACPFGTYSFSGAGACTLCPTLGVRCDGGVLRPLHGHWSPCAMVAGGGAACALFDSSTDIFPCLTKRNTSCIAAAHDDDNAANDDGRAILTPATAWRCATGHRGVLCASCNASYFYKKKRCVPCDVEFTMSAGTQAALAALGLALAAFLALKLVVKRYREQIKRALHKLRRATRRARLRVRRRRGGGGGNKPQQQQQEDWIAGAVDACRTRVRCTVIQVAHVPMTNLIFPLLLCAIARAC